MGLFGKKKKSKQQLEAANSDSGNAPSENVAPCRKVKAAAKMVIENPKAVAASDYRLCTKKRLKVILSAVDEKDLKSSVNFDGEGRLSCNKAAKKSVKFYSATSGGTPLSLPLKLTGHSLDAGKEIYIEGVKNSEKLEDLQLTLTIKKKGGIAVGSPAKDQAKFTSVSVILNYKPPQANKYLNAKDKEEQGVALLLHRDHSPRDAGDLEISLLPKDFKCKLILKQKKTITKIYETKPSGDQAELTLPKSLKHSDLEEGKKLLTLQGKTLSSNFLDSNFEIDIEGLQDKSDGLPVTVFDFTIEDGSKPAPYLIPVKNPLTTAPKTYEQKIKLLPDVNNATYKWESSSTKFLITDETKQTVLLSAKDAPSSTPRAEKLKVEVQPNGKAVLPTFQEKMGVVKIQFKEHADNPGGYDAYEILNCIHQNGTAYTSDPTDKYDFVSVEKSSTGKVITEYRGADKKDIFFTSKDEAIGKSTESSPTSASPWDMELEAEAKDKDETIIYARVCDKNGPIVAQIGLVVLKKSAYEAEFFKVQDSANNQTNLSHSGITGASITTGLKASYKSGISTLTVSGGASITNVDYDTGAGCTQNGKLDMEPGVTSAEQTKITAACVSTKTRVIYVHSLRWSYYFRNNAAIGDTVIKIKAYQSVYLGYIGVGNSYTLEDTDGKSERVTVTAVNTATGDVTISSALTKAFTTAKKAALVWPLGGLSGNPAWVQDSSTADQVIEVIGHELGHQLGSFKDICEKANLMYGVNSRTSKRLRHRPLDSLYPGGSAEKQWLTLPRP